MIKLSDSARLNLAKAKYSKLKTLSLFKHAYYLTGTLTKLSQKPMKDFTEQDEIDLTLCKLLIARLLYSVVSLNQKYFNYQQNKSLKQRSSRLT